ILRVLPFALRKGPVSSLGRTSGEFVQDREYKNMALTEVTVLIPEERVGDFYRVVGAWMGGADLQEETPVRRGRKRRGSAEGAANLTLSASSRYAPLADSVKLAAPS